MRVLPARFSLSAALAIAAGSALAGEPRFFYCYAPDAASGTVYVSQALPVGPVDERASYGAAFAMHLKAQGRVRDDIQAYCVLRATAGEISRSRAALSSEPCPECADANRFEGVIWPRGGSASRATLETLPVPPTTTPATTQTASNSKRDAASGPWLVVMGNAETGKLLVVSNQPNIESVANAQAKLIRPTGWKTLLVTSEPGFGAAFCVRHEGIVRFFVAHAQPSIKEAVAQAGELAVPYELETGQKRTVCGAPWRAQPGIDVPREEEIIDVIEDAVREQVACDRNAKPDDLKARPCPPPTRGAAGTRG